MSKAGRPNTPAVIKQLQGTLRADRQKGGVKFELVTAVPKPEVWMSAKGKKYFKTQCQLLIDHSLLDVANVQLVAIMAEEWATYEEACRNLEIEGKVFTSDKGYQQQSPWIGIRNNAQKNYREVASLFGLDLLSSQKIGSVPKDDGDEFTKMMREHEKE